MAEGTLRWGQVSATLVRPPKASVAYVLGHGAGAGMRHRFMESIADALAAEGVATFRYQFPYVEAGRRSPDRPAVLQATVRTAVDVARDAVPDLPLVAGGKSLGGRMTSSAAAKSTGLPVEGLVFFLGFPLHAPNKPGDQRAEHLGDVRVPMLFLQGTRDALADLGLMKNVCRRLGERATLVVVEDADHSFNVPKRSGRSHEEIMGDLAQSVAEWATRVT